MADTDRCFGTGFAYKILPRPDLAFVGNPLYFKIEMDFLGRSRSSLVAKSFECGKIFVFIVFFLPPPTIICFPVLMFGDLFPHHVGLCLIIALLLWCPNFIPLPCHLIMYCMQSFASMFCFVFQRWWIYLHYWLMLGHVLSMRVLLWCAHVVGDPMATPQHIFFSIVVQLDL